MGGSRRRSGVLGEVLAAALVAVVVIARVATGDGQRGGAPGARPPERATGTEPEADGSTPEPAPGARPGNVLGRSLDRMDGFQRRVRPLAFTVAVIKKFTEDRAGQLAALVAYYSFFSIFPLLFALVTLLRVVLAGNEELQREIVDSAVAQFPVVGSELTEDLDARPGSTVAVVVGLAGALWAGLRAMTAAQNALDEIWDVPIVERPNFLFSRLRGLALMGVLAAGVLGSIAVSNVAALADGLPGGGRLALYAGSVALNIAVVGGAYLVLTDLRLRVDQILPGAVLGGASYWLLQLAGSVIVRQSIAGAEGANGTFAVVIGLLTWLFLVAQVTLVAAEVNVVRCRRLWPRSLTGRNLTGPDVRAYTSHARQARRSEVITVQVSGEALPGGDATGPRHVRRREPPSPG